MRYFHIPTDDPELDADRFDRDDTQWLMSRPRCACCGEPIQADVCRQDGRGEIYCAECEELGLVREELYPVLTEELLGAWE